MTRHYQAAIFSLQTCLLIAPLQTLAHEPSYPLEPDHELAKALVASGEIRSLDQTLTELLHQCDAELLDAHLYQSDGQWRYDLYIKFRQGIVQSLLVDASNGALISPDKLPGDCLPDEATAR
ncbi:PepSY domain-containing protein [Shewanella sp.]|uniref:PepSY domain-containing protein n=1 Tax=Shewanella sp. TaxID=50422 RepID=UPI003A972BB9